MTERLTIKYKPRYKDSKEKEIEVQSFWQEHPELYKALLKLPRKLVLSDDDMTGGEIQRLLTAFNFLPIRLITIIGVSEKALVDKRDQILKSGYNRKISLKGNYSKELRQELEETTKGNLGQLVTIANQPSDVDLSSITGDDLIIHLGTRNFPLSNGSKPFIRQVHSWGFEGVELAIIDFSKRKNGADLLRLALSSPRRATIPLVRFIQKGTEVFKRDK
ncbi:MAG: hypothetical protein A2152_01400 [Candidatus Levybacteria bacterium RBG_16_35_6]|nr:MAG: hypothetical protein A2152_01400 [Candidatus Levybacteria bacterium RBG_16_35_6]